MPIVAPHLFPFLRVFNFFIDFFSIFTRLCRSWNSAVLQPQTCNVFVLSIIKLRAVFFRSSPGVPFVLAVLAAVFAPYAPGLSAPSCPLPVWHLLVTRRSEWFGRFSVVRMAIVRPRLRSSLPFLVKYFSAVPSVLRCGRSLHCGDRESMSEFRITLRAAKVSLESGIW